MMKWLENSLDLLVYSGSRAYGTSTPESDVDIRGICTPPINVREDLFHRFDEANNPPLTFKGLHLGEVDSKIYSSAKFIKLASEVNPNIIEILYTDESDWIMIGRRGRKLIEKRDLFLSRRAGFTFLGYAVSQIKRIQRHKKWLDNPPKSEPKRSDFGLPQSEAVSNSLAKRLKARVEEWNFHNYPFDEDQRIQLKNDIFDLVNGLTNLNIHAGNWPQLYKEAAFNELCQGLNLSEEIVDLLHRESRYYDACQTWKSYINWKSNRNKKRAEIEIKYGYDCKHACQLVRLIRMAEEILSSGKVLVKRPDAKELLEIKNGGWSYEKVVEYADQTDKKINSLIENSPLPQSVNKVEINKLYQEIINEN